MSTLKDKILKFKDPKTEVITIEEWDNQEVTVKGLRGSQMDAIMDAADKKSSTSDMMFNLIILCCVDEKGEAIFTSEDLPALKEMPLGPIQKLGTKCMEVNGFSGDITEKKKI